MPQSVRRQKSYPYIGRLIVLEGPGDKPLLDGNYTGEYTSAVQINFPAMPDTIELARRANYTVRTSPAFPDGIHQYMGTEVLNIPISFELHHADREYCPKGPYTLLQLAAELESLILPFGSDAIQTEVGETFQSERTNAAVNQSAAQPTQELGGNVINGESLYPPPVCYLQLMLTESTGPGIACRGYVNDINVKLHGPYMRGPGMAFNLPTKGTFSFTFVHNPGHQNAFPASRYSTVSVKQAYAQTVRRRLFNTVGIQNPANYKGFNESP